MKWTLKALRINNSLKQEEAAKKLEISTSTLASWENGRTFPNAMEIRKIMILYSVSYDDIIFLPHKSV